MKNRNRGKALVYLLVVSGLAIPAHAVRYHVNTKGLDGANSDGTSKGAFRTVAYALERATKRSLAKGAGGNEPIEICLAPGQIFAESIVLGPEIGGNPDIPILLTSDPDNPAIITSPRTAAVKTAAIVGGAVSAAAGISVHNRSNVTLENQVIKGSGMDANSEEGINCYSDNGRQTNLRILNCSVSGWGKTGIVIGGWGAADYGWQDVLVEGCEVYANKINGMSTYGQSRGSNRNITVRRSVFHGNLGDPAAVKNTGSGCILGNVTGGLIEYCTAYGNGGRCKATEGPVGIWMYDSDSVTIQYCEAYGNKTGGPADGGGFDIDGGSRDCIIQYCWSHGNDGAGFLMAQYSGAAAFSGNKIRYNVSQNDGGKNGYGAIHIWSSGASGGIRDCAIYNNTIYVASGSASAIRFASGGIGPLSIRNNIFMTAGGRSVIKGTVPGNAVFEANCYFGGTVTIKDAKAVKADPNLTSPGQGGTLGTDKLAQLSAYRLRSGSPCINKGVSINGSGGKDFFGTAVPQQGGVDIGAHEIGETVSLERGSFKSGTPADARLFFGAGTGSGVSDAGLVDLRGRFLDHGPFGHFAY